MNTKVNRKLHMKLSTTLLIWSMLCLSFVCLYLNGIKSNAASKYGCITPGITNVYFRESPAGNPITYNGANIMLNGGQELEILSTKNSSWYKVSLIYAGNEYTGYVSSSFVTIYSEESGGNSGDTDFENYLNEQGFPESYKEQLRSLHALHPNWVFKAVHTGLDWEDVVANEVNISGRVNNMVEGYSGNPRYNWRSTTVGYNYKTDKWSSYDGSTWFAASDELVTYYLDPRVYLYEKFIFAFETLSYDSSQTKDGVESILYGTFMANSKPSGSSSTYAELMVTAGKKSGVSPYHIASRIKQEIGASITSGTNGKNTTYPGIYNFYNIGAFASPEGNAIVNGLKWASTGSSYGRPWTSAYKSILGGAQYIGDNYILKGQNTLYTQKFNVTYTDCLYSHQYMGNVQAVSSEAQKVYAAYSGSGTLGNAITFSIPVYKNMPATMVSKPSDYGNPNNYLKSLTVSGYNLSPKFSVSKTTAYTLDISSDKSSVDISATTVNSSATVSGTGNISLKKGKNTIKIVVTAQNGDKRTYKLTINRGTAANPSNETDNKPENAMTFDGSYTIADGYITNVSPSTSVSSFTKKLGASGSISITDADGTVKKSGDVGTGDKVITGDTTYQIVIYGDVNGDGKISALDLLKIQKHLMGSSSLKGAALTAANVKHKDSVSALDLLKVQKYIMGSGKISQK